MRRDIDHMGRTSVTHYGDPADHLAELFLRVLGHPPYHREAAPLRLSPPARIWLVGGVLLALREGLNLGVALGLNKASVQEISNRLKMVKRNAHIAEAVRLAALDDQVSQWQRCQRLVPFAKEINSQWTRLRDLPDVPADWPGAKQQLYLARQAYPRTLPKCGQAFQDAAKKARAYELEARPHNMLANYL